jgi:hypothetical protein
MALPYSPRPQHGLQVMTDVESLNMPPLHTQTPWTTLRALPFPENILPSCSPMPSDTRRHRQRHRNPFQRKPWGTQLHKETRSVDIAPQPFMRWCVKSQATGLSAYISRCISVSRSRVDTVPAILLRTHLLHLGPQWHHQLNMEETVVHHCLSSLSP